VFHCVLKTLALSKLWQGGAVLCDIVGDPLPTDGKIYSLKRREINPDMLTVFPLGRDRLLGYAQRYYFDSENVVSRPPSVISFAQVPPLQETVAQARRDAVNKTTTVDVKLLTKLFTIPELLREIRHYVARGECDSQIPTSKADLVALLAVCRTAMADTESQARKRQHEESAAAPGSSASAGAPGVGAPSAGAPGASASDAGATGVCTP
jgi:hypothetical protein